MYFVSVTDMAPTADFSYLPNPAALTIDFTDQSTSYDELVSWAWDFGDGEISAMPNPTHKFPDNGTFSVSLTVTDADGSVDAITKQVLTYLPDSPFDNAFRSVSLYISLLAISASFGIFLLVRTHKFRSKPAEKSE